MTQLSRTSQYLLLVALASVAGCIEIPADPAMQSTREQFDALSHTDAAARAAPEMAAAQAAVEAAEHPHGDADDAAHLAFIAQKRVDIARLTAETRRDNEAYRSDVAQRDLIRHKVDSITTLSTDALDYTPPSLKPIPVSANSTPMKDFPPSASSTPPAEPPPAPTAILTEEPPALVPQAPLLVLDRGAFSGDALTTDGRRQVNAALKDLARWSRTPVNIVYGTAAAKSKAMSVKTTLIATGVPGDRFTVQQGDAAGGLVMIQFAKVP